MSLRLSNRRKKNDQILRLLAVCNFTAVASLFLAIFVVSAAKPKRTNFLDHFFGVQRLNPAWDMDLVSYVGLLLLLSFVASIAGLYFNSKRLKRKGDHVNATLVLSLIASIISLFFYFRFTLT